MSHSNPEGFVDPVSLVLTSLVYRQYQPSLLKFIKEMKGFSRPPLPPHAPL